MAMLKARRPIVDGLARDAQRRGNLFDALAIIQEQQSEGALIES
jgi:hypothetical protein